MKRIRIEIKTENAAFGDDPDIEVARILVRLARDFEVRGEPGPVMDYNGNKVGTVKIT